MIFFDLRKHNIDFFIPDDMDITETEIGSWLNENNIEYKVTKFRGINIGEVILLGLFSGVVVTDLQFFSEEGVVAFKLRWAN